MRSRRDTGDNRPRVEAVGRGAAALAARRRFPMQLWALYLSAIVAMLLVKVEGTAQEWPGGHLVYESTATERSVLILGVVAARIVSDESRQWPGRDVGDPSPANEILPVMYEHRQHQLM